MKLQFMLQVPQDDLRSSALMFRVKKRWDVWICWYTSAVVLTVQGRPAKISGFSQIVHLFYLLQYHFYLFAKQCPTCTCLSRFDEMFLGRNAYHRSATDMWICSTLPCRVLGISSGATSNMFDLTCILTCTKSRFALKLFPNIRETLPRSFTGFVLEILALQHIMPHLLSKFS